MKKIYRLEGKIQNYAWGGRSFIPELLGRNSRDKPVAEYWLGAHDNSPSVLVDNEQTLNDFIREAPLDRLGHQTATMFGRLPYLFKVLDVKNMLSIQVHPTKKEAEMGFAAENEKGINLQAANRNYKDDNHKPEIMVALSDFWLLHGFKPKNELADTLKDTPELKYLMPVVEKLGYKGLYEKVMLHSKQQIEAVLKPLKDRILPRFHQNELSKNSADFWAAKAFEYYGFDPGIFSIYIFNIVKLAAGQAIFQNAGVPHAYLEGQNMELMANSDNVLRGGLTPKYVNTKELLKIVKFEATTPDIIEGELQPDQMEVKYFSPAPDFELSKISIKKGEQYQGYSESCEIILNMNGLVDMLEHNHDSLRIEKGQSVLITADCHYSITSKSNSVMYKAKTATSNSF
ncbi:MAG: mannose-6-phosphate isomerase, class I [Bacteroidota bacterium]